MMVSGFGASGHVGYYDYGSAVQGFKMRLRVEVFGFKGRWIFRLGFGVQGIWVPSRGAFNHTQYVKEPDHNPFRRRHWARSVSMYVSADSPTR